MKKNIFKIGVLIGLGFGLFSCESSDEPGAPLTSEERESQLSALADDSRADEEYEAAEAEAYAAIEVFNGTSNGRMAEVEACIEVISDTAYTVLAENEIKIINEYTVDFGEGCAVEVNDTYTRVRQGKIHVIDELILSGNENYLSAKRTFTFDEFFVNGVKVEGTKETQWIAQEGENDRATSILTGGKLTFEDETFLTREASWQIEKTAGENFFSEEFSVTGNASGTKRNGREYTMEVTSPLIIKRTCGFVWFPVEGSKRFSGEGHTLDVDFGDGECDGYVVEVSFDGGEPIEVDLSEESN